MLGNRSFERISKAIFAPHTYAAFWGMFRSYVNPIDSIRRYVFGLGEYPHQIEVRTPLGTVAPTLHSKHDILTVNEIFCRGDYFADKDINVVIDIGANIGLSALYFLTRNQHSYCYLFEPNPNNVSKLKENLALYEDRYTLFEKAVSMKAGEFSFGLEESGRYGGLDKKLGSKASYEQPSIEETITVECWSINDVLEAVLKKEEKIDIVKIDTEGSEFETVMAIDPSNGTKISTIYIESQVKPELIGFKTQKFKTVFKLDRCVD